MTENKKVMANNILYYMNANNTSATEICKTLHIKQNTFSDWVNAKTYPRIDKIEMLANYFGVSKSDLVEERADHPQDPAACSHYSFANDPIFMEYVLKMWKLPPERKKSIYEQIDFQTGRHEEDQREKEKPLKA